MAIADQEPVARPVARSSVRRVRSRQLQCLGKVGSGNPRQGQEFFAQEVPQGSIGELLAATGTPDRIDHQGQIAPNEKNIAQHFRHG